MFEQTITLIKNRLENPQDGDNTEALQTELDLLENIKGSILELEVADEDQEVDPMDTLKNNPNILFFKNEEAGFLNAAIQTKKLIDQIVHLNVPQNTGFDFSQIINSTPTEEVPNDVIDGESTEVVDTEEIDDENVNETKDEEVAGEE